jgi:hypothetical protein
VPNRVAVFVGMWLAMAYVPPEPPAAGVTLGDRPNAANVMLDGWFRWDVHWYRQLARFGYQNPTQNGVQRDTAFFPAFPLLVRLVNLVIPDTYVAGMIATNACFVLAAFLLFRLVERRHGSAVAKRAVLLMLVYPWSFILSAMYTESLFLASVLAAFYFAESERWSLAGLCAAVTGATRVLGFSVVIGLAVLYLEKRQWRWRGIRPEVLGIGLSALGPGLQMLYLWKRFGDPFLFLRSQDVGGWSGPSSIRAMLTVFASFFDSQSLMSGAAPVPAFVHLVALACGVIACVMCLRRSRAAYGVWGLSYLALSSYKWDSMGRFVVVIFPLYIAGALSVRKSEYVAALVAMGCVLMGILMVLFSHWRLVT